MRVGAASAIAAAAIAAGSLVLVPGLAWGERASAQAAQTEESPGGCDPNVGIAVDYVTVEQEQNQLSVRVPIQVTCERLRTGGDQYLVYLNPRNGDPTPVDCRVEARQGGLDVLFWVDIDPAYLVSTRYGYSRSMEFLELLYSRLVDAFQFRGNRPSDVATVLSPSAGLLAERRLMDGNQIYNQLVEAACQLSIDVGNAGEPGTEKLRQWIRDCGGECEAPLVLILSWRPDGVGHLAAALEEARATGVPVHILSVAALQEEDERLVEGLGASVHPLYGEPSLVGDRGGSEDVRQFSRLLDSAMPRLEREVDQTRLCALSFTTGTLIEGSQVERVGDYDLTRGLFVRVSRRTADNSIYDCWLPLAFTSRPPSGRNGFVPWVAILVFFTFLPLGLVSVYVLGLLHPELDVFLKGWLKRMAGP